MNATFYLGLIIALTGLAVLIVTAFRKDKNWGLMSLLMLPPLGPMLFAITHWRIGREGFALTLVGMLIVGYGTINSDWWYQRKAASKQVTEQLAANAAVDPSDNSATTADDTNQTTDTSGSHLNTSLAAPVQKKAIVKQTSVKELAYRSVEVANASQYIGQNVRVTEISNVSHEAVLKGLKDKKIVFEKQYESRGSLIFELIPRNIKKLEVAYWRKKRPK